MKIDREMKDDILFQCLENADVKERIESMSNGISTYIGKGTGYNGVDMSGGEKQKVAIGRMYAKDAEIFILDEATAAVDPISEDKIFKNMIQYGKDHMIIFISHRMSNAKLSEKLFILIITALKNMGDMRD